MKKSAFNLIFLSLILLVTASCQATPDEAIVINKGDNKLETIINESTAPIDDLFIAPADWQDKIVSSQNDLIIHVKATIDIPSSRTFPVIEIEKDEISSSMAREIIESIAGEQKFFTTKSSNTLTKSEIEELILRTKQEINSFKYDTNTSNIDKKSFDEIISNKNKLIESLEASYQNAPEVITDTEFGFDYRLSPDGKEYYIDGEVREANNSTKLIQFFKPLKGGGGMFVYSNFGKSIQYPTVLSSETNIHGTNLESAKNNAREFLSMLGIEGFDVSLICSGYMPDEKIIATANYSHLDFPRCLILYFTRKNNNIRITYRDSSQDILYLMNPENDQKQYFEYWPQEYIEVIVTDSKVSYVKWESPIKQTAILNENIRLLPFEKIKDIFVKQILTNGMWNDFNDQSIIGREINIDRIVLGYSQIRKINEPNKMMLVPTWTFFGRETYQYQSQQPSGDSHDSNNKFENDRAPGHDFLCINAIDGSIINPVYGY